MDTGIIYLERLRSQLGHAALGNPSAPNIIGYKESLIESEETNDGVIPEVEIFPEGWRVCHFTTRISMIVSSKKGVEDWNFSFHAPQYLDLPENKSIAIRFSRERGFEINQKNFGRIFNKMNGELHAYSVCPYMRWLFELVHCAREMGVFPEEEFSRMKKTCVMAIRRYVAPHYNQNNSPWVTSELLELWS